MECISHLPCEPFVFHFMVIRFVAPLPRTSHGHCAQCALWRPQVLSSAVRSSQFSEPASHFVCQHFKQAFHVRILLYFFMLRIWPVLFSQLFIVVVLLRLVFFRVCCALLFHGSVCMLCRTFPRGVVVPQDTLNSTSRMHKSQATRCHPLCPDFIKYKYFPFRWGYVGLNGDRRRTLGKFAGPKVSVGRPPTKQGGLSQGHSLKSGLSRGQVTSAGSLEAERKIKREDEQVEERGRERHGILQLIFMEFNVLLKR